jgi:hypothetical protein
MPIDRKRTLRGAVAGAVAAGVWAAQQPLDKRLFRSRYDDVELLGKAVTRSRGWYPAGLAMHVQNGMAFGALYANLAPLAPAPAWALVPVTALLEHAALWPLMLVIDHVHPARDDLPRFAGNRRALAQATWRHLLFGAVLGELERRLNADAAAEVPAYEETISTNGHGRIERAVAGPAS